MFYCFLPTPIPQYAYMPTTLRQIFHVLGVTVLNCCLIHFPNGLLRLFFSLYILWFYNIQELLGKGGAKLIPVILHCDSNLIHSYWISKTRIKGCIMFHALSHSWTYTLLELRSLHASSAFLQLKVHWFMQKPFPYTL